MAIQLSLFDPFCLNNKATQLLPEEIIRIAGEEVRIQPYILPITVSLRPKSMTIIKAAASLSVIRGYTFTEITG